MTQSKKILLTVLMLGAIVAVVLGASVAARFYLGGAEQRSAATICKNQRGVTHTVTISKSQLSRTDVSAQLCDELIIINNDADKRRLAFGTHDHHEDYDGADGRLIGRGEKVSLVLTKRGEFIFHDHFDHAVQGAFTVE